MSKVVDGKIINDGEYSNKELELLSFIETYGVLTGSRSYFDDERIKDDTDYDYVLCIGNYLKVWDMVESSEGKIKWVPNYKGGIKLEICGKSIDVWGNKDENNIRVLNNVMKSLDNDGVLKKIGKSEYVRIYAILSAFLENV